MVLFIAIHARYHDIQFGLFNNNVLVDSTCVESKQASSQFITIIEELLIRNSLAFNDLTFIAAHQGPAPFTTLRVSLASVNGLVFSNQLPLIGVDGLLAFVTEHKQTTYPFTVALLNAFCEDIYYGILNSSSQSFHKGYAPVHAFLEKTSQAVRGDALFIGNGLERYKELVEQYFGDRAHFLVSNPQLVSLAALGAYAFDQWLEQKSIARELMPIYLKGYSNSMIPINVS